MEMIVVVKLMKKNMDKWKYKLFFSFQTTFAKIDSQNPEKPILYDEKNSLYDIMILGTTFKNYFLRTLKWKVIKYIEKKGLSWILDKLLDRKNEYFTAYFSSNNLENSDSFVYESNGNYYKFLMGMILKILMIFMMNIRGEE